MMFKKKKIHSYTNQDLTNLFTDPKEEDYQFKNIFCRGSSRKEKIDTNHKLLIFIQHGSYLISAKCELGDEGDAKMVLKLVSRIHSDNLYLLTNNKFMFLDNSQKDGNI